MPIPEDLCDGRKIHTIPTDGTHEVLFDRGGDALFQSSNDRGSFEILCTGDRGHAFRAALASSLPLQLTGFFRKRIGYCNDRSRKLVWCFVLLSWRHA